MSQSPQPGTSDGTATGPRSKAERRRLAAAERAEQQRRAEQRRSRRRWGLALLLAVVAAGGAVYVTSGGGANSSASEATSPWVGGDLHTVEVIGSSLYVGGHDAVAVSVDGGKQWRDVPSLRGADAMGWAVTPGGVLVGGHPGLYRSADGGTTFAKAGAAAAVDDVHAIGSSGSTVYIGSPQSGLLASADGGRTWQVRNAQAGQSFMGTILVDPANPAHLIAPDMNSGLMASSDGGRSWKPLGGPGGAMAAAWNPRNTRQIVAVGMNDAQISADGGATWKPVAVPQGTSAIAYDATGTVLYAGVLNGENARVDRSTDAGAAWTATS